MKMRSGMQALGAGVGFKHPTGPASPSQEVVKARLAEALSHLDTSIEEKCGGAGASAEEDEELPSCMEASVETTSSEEEPEAGFMPITGRSGQSRRGESPAEGRALRRSSRGSFTWGSLEDLLSLDPEGHESSMWLGCEDGCIHV
ncbi:rho guanine nucleotide exchange factor 17-like [Melanerpes formicivorus]|uniref:rho guanine nucleotide exchange factor 17-like n=1 Tax=Melanerpes formicivorus TaxID=211600 RepID=UPI00358F2BC6